MALVAMKAMLQHANQHGYAIGAYESHPLHRAFADNHSRPHAPDRITTDFRLFDLEPTESGAFVREERAHA